LGSFGSLVRDIGQATYDIPYLGNVCFAATNFTEIVSLSYSGYIKTDPQTGKKEKVKAQGIIDAVRTARRLASVNAKNKLEMPEASALGTAQNLQPPAALSADGETSAAKDSGLIQARNEAVMEAKSGAAGFVKDGFIFSNKDTKEQAAAQESPAEQAAKTAANPSPTAPAPASPPPPPPPNPALDSDISPLRADGFNDRLFLSGVPGNVILDTMDKDASFHFNNHYNIFAQQTATSRHGC